jgi:molecular chaperone HscB
LSVPFVCEGCQTLHPIPRSVDYFELLGLPRAFDLDTDLLQQRFLSLSRHVHPDYFAQAEPQMRSLSVRLAAELNAAVKVLGDPVQRAGYLLETFGGPSPAQDRTVPPDVLADAMMLRESIEEAKANGNSKELAELRQMAGAKRGALIEKIASLARKLPESDDAEKAALRHAINSVKYYNNMMDILWED